MASSALEQAALGPRYACCAVSSGRTSRARRWLGRCPGSSSRWAARIPLNATGLAVEAALAAFQIAEFNVIAGPAFAG